MSGVEGGRIGGPVEGDVTEAEHEITGEPFDAETHEAESAAHDKFLETYEPVITRLPEALADEAVVRAAELKEERVHTLVADLGISEDEARVQVYGPSEHVGDEPAATSEDHEPLPAP